MLYSSLHGLLCCSIICCCCIAAAQQAPYYRAPKFESNVTYRTNICDRQRLLYQDKLDLPNALQGVNVSVVLTNYDDDGSKPFFSLNSEGVIDEEQPGLFAIIMDELAARAGFSWRNSYGVVNPIDPETDGNRTWTDLLEWETKVYDIAAGKWDRNLERMKKEISFPEGWYDASTIIVQANNDKTHLNIWSFLLPFQWGVWILIVMTVLATGFVYFWLDWLNTESDELELEKKPGAAVFYSFVAMTGHLEYKPTTMPARVLSFSLAFFALLVSAAYTANLVSFLVVRNTPENQIATIQEAVLKGVPICVQGMVATDEYVSTKYPKAILKRLATEEDVLMALQKGAECQVAVVPQASYDFYRRSGVVNHDCTLDWYGRVERIVPAGLATAVDSGILCSSLLSDVLDYHLLELKSEGFLERTWREYLDRVGDHYCFDSQEVTDGDGENSSQSEEEKYSLSVQELAGIFIVHAGLSTLAVVVSLISYSCKKWNVDTAAPVGTDDESSKWGDESSISMPSRSNGKDKTIAGSISSRHDSSEELERQLHIPEIDSEGYG